MVLPNPCRPYHATAKREGGNLAHWAWEHNHAFHSPSGRERGIVHILRGWDDYATYYRNRFVSLIGDDGFLGPHWESIGDALRGLLNGDLGCLDGGTLDSAIVTIMKENGIDTEDK